MRYRILGSLFLLFTFTLLQSCKSTKFVPEGEYLLVDASIKSDTKAISAWESNVYIKQRPNFKTFEIFKLPLTIYNLSGSDTTKWVNKVLRNAGEAPVLYDSTKVTRTVIDLRRMMTNKGFLNAEVEPEVEKKNKKAWVTYNIEAGKPYTIVDYNITIPDSIVSDRDVLAFLNKSQKVSTNTTKNYRQDLGELLQEGSLVKNNSLFDLDMLDQERDRITTMFRQRGYYAFNKEYIGFEADTMLGNHNVSLELQIHPFNQRIDGGNSAMTSHKQYEIASVTMYVDFNPLEDGDISRYQRSSTFDQDGYSIVYGPRGRYIKPQIILDNCYIKPGELYDESLTSLTYNSLAQLKILKNVHISFTEFIENNTPKLHCIITCVPDKRQGVSAELEGTNSGGLSGGFFGLGGSLGYLHRNIFKGSEQFGIKVFAAYEAITPNFAKFDDNYFEVGGEMSLSFPRFIFPFLKSDFKKSIHAATHLTGNYTFQHRPGFFTRTVLGGGLKYVWQDRKRSTIQHVVDLIDISYIHIPHLDSEFEKDLSDQALLYSFRDQFIMSGGYTFSKTNLNNPFNKKKQSFYTLRGSVETAGNLLSLAAKIGKIEPDSLGSRKVFDTYFAQYVKGTADYSYNMRIDEKNFIAWRVGVGIAYPYGNFKQIPIQKRFFSGGANSVRGWGVRELGPGSMYKPNSNFYDHSGEIRFDAGIEYRSKIFWVVELGAFIDAGNIWTVNNYEDQPGGQFKLNSFYKEIAVAWGLGLRLDFDFAVVRLDCGWKAYNPSNDPNRTRWPIKDPHKIKKNTAWHIAIGYPF